MCGIAGIAGIRNLPDAQQRCTGMIRSMSYRGPDGEGLVKGDDFVFAHRRLSIIDLSEAASQPMTDYTRRYTIVFNGEIYNYRELKKQFSRYPFQTASDTEVLLAAFAEFGPLCLDRLNGMFAFAIWDNIEKALILVRDRLGKKPLYLYHDNERLLFSSTIEGILASGLVRPELSQVRLADYLRRQAVHPPHTLLQNVEMLEPGTWAHYKEGRLRKVKWWDPATSIYSYFEGQPDEARKKIRTHLQNAVNVRLVSDVPVGVFLSGGIDSAAITGLMAEAQSEPVNTFSVVFDQPEYDESQWSSLVAKKFNTRHHPVLLKTGDFLSRIPDALKAMDHPSPDGINTFVVSGAVRNEGIKVALTGLGGDELFSGYPQFSQIDRLLTQWKLWFRIHPGIRKSLASWLPKFKPSRRSEALARLLSVNRGRFSDLYPCYRELYNSAQIESLISSDSYVDPVTSYFQNAGINLMSLDFFAKMSHAELLNYASPVLLQDADQMSMAHGLEVRVPFFDPDLVTFIMSLPDSIRRGKYPKQLLVESLGDLIPPEVVNRPKKGFDLPYDNWLKHELKSFVNTHIESLSARKPFHEKSVRAVWNSYLEGDSHFRWNHIMSLVALESWIQKLVVK